MTDLQIGKEYKTQDINFLTKVIEDESYLTYLGKHPYDGCHMFALKPSGGVYIPKNGEALEKLLEVA